LVVIINGSFCKYAGKTKYRKDLQYLFLIKSCVYNIIDYIFVDKEILRTGFQTNKDIRITGPDRLVSKDTYPVLTG